MNGYRYKMVKANYQIKRQDDDVDYEWIPKSSLR